MGSFRRLHKERILGLTLELWKSQRWKGEERHFKWRTQHGQRHGGGKGFDMFMDPWYFCVAGVREEAGEGPGNSRWVRLLRSAVPQENEVISSMFYNRKIALYVIAAQVMTVKGMSWEPGMERQSVFENQTYWGDMVERSRRKELELTEPNSWLDIAGKSRWQEERKKTSIKKFSAFGSCWWVEQWRTAIQDTALGVGRLGIDS